MFEKPRTTRGTDRASTIGARTADGARRDREHPAVPARAGARRGRRRRTDPRCRRSRPRQDDSGGARHCRTETPPAVPACDRDRPEVAAGSMASGTAANDFGLDAMVADREGLESAGRAVRLRPEPVDEQRHLGRIRGLPQAAARGRCHPAAAVGHRRHRRGARRVRRLGAARSVRRDGAARPSRDAADGDTARRRHRAFRAAGESGSAVGNR